MAKYRCLVINNAGKRKNIVYEANDEFTLKAKLKNEKTILLNYELVKEKKVNTFLAVSSKVKRNEVITFLRQFAVMVKAGIPISNSLNTLRNQKFTKAFKKVLNTCYQDVQSGVLLSDALKNIVKYFLIFL